MQRAQFPTAVSESGDMSDSLNQMADTESGEDTEPRADAIDNETELEEVELAASTSQPRALRLYCLSIRPSVGWTPLS